MQIPIIKGIYSDQTGDFRIAYPINMVPIPQPNGISQGYLRYGDGIVSNGTGPGFGRGGINWNNRLYRVMGDQLVEVLANGTVNNLGTVTNTTDTVSMDYSFDYLATASGGNLYYWDGVTLQQVTDPDLGTVVDFLWIDGYFMTTDGTFLIVTELNDPFAVNPVKYGSSELDPDPVVALLKLRNEAHALNRYTIEAFDNVGGTGFPFQRIDGAQIQRGCIGTHACAVFLESIAFVGGGRNEAISIWLASGGQSARIATREIDLILKNYSETTLSQVLMEVRVDEGHQHLLVHLPDQTLVYDANASRILGDSVWFIQTTAVARTNQGGLQKLCYRARHLVWCYDQWLVTDPMSINMGYLTKNTGHHWGEMVGWEFNTSMIYQESLGVIFHQLELVALPGRQQLGVNTEVTTQYSLDGETWSQPKTRNLGQQGNRKKRLLWLNQGSMRNYRIQRFWGTSDAQLSVTRLEAKLEALGA